MLTEEKLLDFARDCAKIYCKRYAAWSQLDDAVGEAALFLLRSKKKELTPKELKRRVVLRLVRWYQDDRKLRSKYRKAETQIDYLDAPICDDSFERFETNEENLLAIKRAASNAGLLDYLDLILDLAAGASVADAAKKYKTSLRVVRSMRKDVLLELKKIAVQRGAIREDEFVDSCPLFSLKNVEK